MLTLAIECATKSIGLAILDEGDVHAELYLRLGRHHAEVLLPALDRLFIRPAHAGMPGSAGLYGGPWFVYRSEDRGEHHQRACSGNGKADSRGIHAGDPCNECHSLLPLICPMFDARKDQVYTGLYRTGPDNLPGSVRNRETCRAPQSPVELDQEEIIFLGDGALRHEKLIRETRESPDHPV